MMLFRYQALTKGSLREDGQIEASSAQHAMSLLSQRQLSVFDISLVSGTSKLSTPFLTRMERRPAVAWRAGFYRQLSVLLEAGIPLDRALSTLKQQARRPWEITLLDRIGTAIAEGRTLSTVLMSVSGRFETFETGMLAVGETGGSIAPVLQDLALTMERQLNIETKVTSALTYPAFLMALAPLSLVLIASVLVPNIAPLFEATSAPMPFMLRAMVAAHGVVSGNPVTSAFGVLAVLFFVFWVGSRRTVQDWAKARFRSLPFIGRIVVASESSRLCRLLATLLRNGAPLQVALATLENTTSNANTRAALQRIQRAVSSGKKLSFAFTAETLLSKGTPEMIAIGEETNQLESMLSFAAASQEQESAALIERLMTLLVPLITVLMGLLVGGIMLSVMQAILSINQLAAQ
jgi:general secretion pathway protein F